MYALVLAAALGQFDFASADYQAPVTFDLMDTPAAAASKVGTLPTIPEDSEEVLRFYSTDKCEPCRKAKADLKRLNFKVEYLDPPDWTNGLAFPIIHWHTPHGWRKHVGWKGLDEFLNFYDASFQGTVVESVPEEGMKYHTYPVHGVTWHINGSAETRQQLINHLYGDGKHAGKFDLGWLNTLSRAQLMTLHDDDHRNVVEWSSVNMRAVSPVNASIPQMAARSAPRKVQWVRACPTCPWTLQYVN